VLDRELLKQAKAERDKLVDLQHEVERARSDYHHTIRRLNAAGGSLREIADELGLSHQRVHQIVDVSGGEARRPHPHFPPLFARRGRRKGGGFGPFARFTPRARHAVVLAQEEAQRLRHSYVGTEHILLGLLREEEGVAGRVLAAIGVRAGDARAQIVRVVGEGESATAGQIPFTPRAKKVFELALREALGLGHDHIGTEHLLLGLALEDEGLAAGVLHQLGADVEKIRAEIERQLAA
jgi:hypothetical protein